MKIVKIENITVKKNDHILLNDIRLFIKKNQNWAIMGPNGSGKTVLGQLILKEVYVKAGYVSFEKEKAILEKERKDDETDILNYPDPGRTATEYLQENCRDISLINNLAKQFHFTDLLNRGLKYLSSGEMRKIIISEALIDSPELLILDEPFDSLDLQSREDLTSLLQKLVNNGKTIILLLNRFSDLPSFTSHIGYMKNKKLLLSGSSELILKSEELQRLHYFQNKEAENLPESYLSDKNLYKGETLAILRNVNVSYEDKIVLDNLNWKVKRGEHWKITGPNGVGKSTLLNLISGDNQQAYNNNITLFGMRRGMGETVWDIKKHIGFVSSSFQTNYRVKTTVLLTVISGFFDSIGVYTNYTELQKNTAVQWLKTIRMEKKMDQPLHSLSFGEQRMILIIRAMVKHPPLLILDEPCQGLDEINRLMILQLIELIAKGSESTVLYVTHYEEDKIDSIKKELKFNFKIDSKGSEIKIFE